MAQTNGRTTAARRDQPWIFRTYAGHSTAHESNKLYRQNLAKGQTGLSIAFDSTPQKDWMRRVQRLATALTITTVVNNPPAMATVVK